MRHVARTHLVNLDWLVDSVNLDSNISVKHVHTNQQIADFVTTSLTRDKWNELIILFGCLP